MTTFAKLKSRVSMLVNDPDMEDRYGDFINQGLAEIAGGMQSTLGDWITPPLPELLTISTVNTDTSVAYVNMPTTFQRNLQLAVRSTGQQVNIANSFIEFTETYPLLDRSGIISEVIEHGGKIYYQGIPTSSEELTVHFYKAPTVLDDNSDVPEGIPAHLHDPLLVNFAAWKAYEHIEDGLEGETINTQKYMNFFLSALRTLELSIPDYTHGLELR